MRYLLEYAQPRASFNNPETTIFERGYEIIEASNFPIASLLADLFLGNRKRISLGPLIGALPYETKPKLQLVVNNDVSRE
jgi:hypothetical protein